MDTIQFPGTEQFKQKRGYLREITEDVFYSGGESLIFRAFDHENLLPKRQYLVATQMRQLIKVCLKP